MKNKFKKSIFSVLLCMFVYSALHAQNVNTELGIHFFSASTKKYWSIMKGDLGYKTTVGFPVFNENYVYDDLHTNKNIRQKRSGTPDFFVRQRIIKNWWIKINGFYTRHHVFNTDTVRISWFTGSTTYDHYNSDFKELVLGISPQFQWYNQKRWYINSGINFNISAWHLAMENRGFAFGCFYCGPFNESFKRSGISLHSLLSAHSIAYRVYKRFNIGYETMLGYDNVNNNFIFRNSIFASVMFR